MWGSDSVASLKTKWSNILNRSDNCFKSKRKLVFLGFSNGGNFLNQVFQACAGGNYIAVGASGGRVGQKLKDLSACGNYYAAIGKRDMPVYEKGNKLISKFKKMNANIKFIEFDGGHELPEPVLLKLLKETGI